MEKSQRQKLIADLVSTIPIARQEELSRALSEHGCSVTQASISRDLDEMGITKVGGRYSLPSKPLGWGSDSALTLLTAGENLIVGRCRPGMASAAAVRIDSLALPQIVGTIAGDDTIFIAVKDPADQKAVIRKILESN